MKPGSLVCISPVSKNVELLSFVFFFPTIDPLSLTRFLMLCFRVLGSISFKYVYKKMRYFYQINDLQIFFLPSLAFLFNLH